MADAEFARKLSELSKIAAELNHETNSINELLGRAEEQIRALNVGLVAFVPLPRPHVNRELGWNFWTAMENGREKRVWQLMLRLPVEADNEFELELKEIHTASREERIAALAVLPVLVEKLKDEALERVETIRNAKRLLGIDEEPTGLNRLIEGDEPTGSPLSAILGPLPLPPVPMPPKNPRPPLPRRFPVR